MKMQLLMLLELFKKEVQQHFFSPLVYILSAFFNLLMGWLFFNYLMGAGALTSSIVKHQVLVPLFGNMNFIFLFLAPLLTMGQFSNESRYNTLNLLLNSKLSLTSILVAKFSASLLVIIFLLLPTFVFPIILAWSGFVDWAMVFTTQAGLLASVSCYLAVGLFASSITKNQVLAAMGSFAFLLSLMLMVFSIQSSDNLLIGQIAQYFSIPFHFENSVRGVIKSFNIVYYVSFIVFFAVLTNHSLKMRRH